MLAFIYFFIKRKKKAKIPESHSLSFIFLLDVDELTFLLIICIILIKVHHILDLILFMLLAIIPYERSFGKDKKAKALIFLSCLILQFYVQNSNE